MRFIDRHADYSDESILRELRRVAHELGKETLTKADFTHAKLCYTTLKHRFGGLRKALERAQLTGPEFHRNVSDDELLRELQKVWDLALAKDGRRPYHRDLGKYDAKFSRHPYYRRWGSWIKACEAILEWEEKSGAAHTEPKEEASTQRETRPKRSIPLRLRYEVLERDNFSCQVCGRSPSRYPGVVELHVDHRVAEAKGGLTELSNLRTLCQDCNIGKGAL
jgi:hypothetical protein